ncbi:MAG: class I SAM-dependent methyltransferase [Spirochaetales bacterium]|nr:class I SAM-dependent methyltransferase [Spirochaetales bacterium]
MKTGSRDAASFRDPSGFLFYHDQVLYRQINRSYKADYEMLMASGLYAELVEKGLLIPHTEADIPPPEAERAYKIIKPLHVPFISYPYEWSFSQLRDAALLTIDVQRAAFDAGMCLKDASAYNIQFLKGKPVLIDTLSFQKYREGAPWVAYRQFCQHFIAPLALMMYKDIRLNQLLKVYIDGIPLDLASSLLPFRSRLSFTLLTHIHLHAGSQKAYEDKAVDVADLRVSPLAFQGIIESLFSAVLKMKWEPKGTEWADYYDKTNYSKAAFEQKKRVVEEFVRKTNPCTVWDLGANTGIFTRIASEKAAHVVSFDIDPAAVEVNYRLCKQENSGNILPLLVDLTNPSPGIGWENRERKSLSQRGPVDMVISLALIHHLAISNNLPFEKIASFFHSLCSHLVIEFIPKEDSQIRKLLSTREDVFPDYGKSEFEKVFSRYFSISESRTLDESGRIIYLMHTI